MLDVLNSWADKRREAVGILRTGEYMFIKYFQIQLKSAGFQNWFKHVLNIQQTRIKN